MSSTTQSRTLAGPIGEQCCLHEGVKHTGEPSGKSIAVFLSDGTAVPTYLTVPHTTHPFGYDSDGIASGGKKRVILFFSDVYGPFYLNNQRLQDYYASQGFHVLGLDYFLGDPVVPHNLEDPEFPLHPWLAKSTQQAEDLVPRWVEAVVELYGKDSAYCAVGYCFGAPYTLDLAATNKIIADATLDSRFSNLDITGTWNLKAAFAHPTSLTEDHFHRLTKPLFLSLPEQDITFPLESRRRAIDILQSKKADYHVQIFSGVVHGFTTRADPRGENDRWAMQESARGIANWFVRWSTIAEKA